MNSNKLSYIFVGVLILVFAAYLLTRADFSPISMAEESSAAKPSEEAVVQKHESSEESARDKLLKDTAGDFYMGNEFAPVVMIEYASLSCPHCARFHADVVEPLVTSHINTGKLKYIYRDFPLNAPALYASKLAKCSGDKKYFSFLKVLFKSQANWAFTEESIPTLKRIAKIGGMSEEDFDTCMANEKIEEEILQTKKEAVEILEVKSTPTIFINGLEYDGRRTHEDVAEHIDGYLTN